MTEIETPKQFSTRTYVCSGCGENSYKCACEVQGMIAELEARDNAVRLALLDEAIERCSRPMSIPFPMRGILNELRAKYQPSKEGETDAK